MHVIRRWLVTLFANSFTLVTLFTVSDIHFYLKKLIQSKKYPPVTSILVVSAIHRYYRNKCIWLVTCCENVGRVNALECKLVSIVSCDHLNCLEIVSNITEYKTIVMVNRATGRYLKHRFDRVCVLSAIVSQTNVSIVKIREKRKAFSMVHSVLLCHLVFFSLSLSLSGVNHWQRDIFQLVSFGKDTEKHFHTHYKWNSKQVFQLWHWTRLE